MPDLSRFAAFANRAGAVSPACSTCSTVAPGQVLQENTNKNNDVSLVAPVAPRNGDGWIDEDWQAAYDERAGILEFMEGLPRAEAERLAKEQVFGDRPTGNVKLTIAREIA